MCKHTHIHIRQFSNTFYRSRIAIRNSFAISRERCPAISSKGDEQRMCVCAWERDKACGREGGRVRATQRKLSNFGRRCVCGRGSGAEAAVECIFGLKFMRSACRWGSWACLELLPVFAECVAFSRCISFSFPLHNNFKWVFSSIFLNFPISTTNH